MKKILSVGEATVDCFMFLSDANVHCTLNHHRCELCLRYAEKVQTDKMDFSMGGNACNAAVAFTRLGLESQLYSIIGNDWLGEKVIVELKKEKVDTQFVEQEPGRTSYANILVYQGERTLVAYHVPRKYHLPKFESVDWIYLTSMGQDFQHAYEQVLAFAQKTGSKISFNPGSYQLHAGVTALKKVLKVSDILSLNLQEARTLTELSAKASPYQIAEELFEFGPKLINLTDGENGVFCFDGHHLLHMKIFPGKVFETTGAGDAYASGFTAAILKGESPDQAMRWGMANSAAVIEKAGAQLGLLSSDRLTDVLNDHPKLQPKTVR